MQCTLLIPHLFWPRDATDAMLRGLALPALNKCIARARVERSPALSTEAWLCRAFEVTRQQDWPIAPLTLALDGGDPGDAYWLRADPVHLKVDRDRLLLVDTALLDVALEDAQSLIDVLNGHFAAQGITFYALQPKRWYAKLPRTPQLATHSTREVAGRDVRHYLPSGEDALACHRAFNEAQMLLHEHAVNEARELRGEPAINSVWLWGGGTLPRVSARPFSSVRSNDDIAGALAAAAEVSAGGVPEDAGTWLSSIQQWQDRLRPHLVIPHDFTSAAAYHDSGAYRNGLEALEARWFAPLLRALHEGRVSELSLVTLGEANACRFELRRGDLRKVWRRDKALSAFA